MESISTTDSFSKYQIGESVGKGAFGKVYKALNTETGDFCAIKQIEKNIISEKQLPAILHEIKLLQTLQHINIVRFIESYETPRYLYFALEFIEGGSLAKITKRYGCFQEPLLSRYICQVLKGLEYLHEKGVIHRDIKGDNILITKEGIIKLADFGSCTYSAIDRKLTVVGTPFWMAPEVIQMDMNARSTACDIWSLGCTLLELLTGNPPYWELGTMPAMFAMVNNQHPPIPSTISPELKHFLLACFVRDINKRPTASQLLEHPWIKQHYQEPGESSKSNNRHSTRLTSLNTYAEGYNSTNSNDSSTTTYHDDEDVDPKEYRERISLLEAQKKEMSQTIQKLKVHFLRAMRDKKAMKDMIAQLVSERDSYIIKLGLTPPPPPSILANISSSNTPTRAALEHASEVLNHHHLPPHSPQHGESKHSRSSSAPISPPVKITTTSPSPSTTSGGSSGTKEKSLNSITNSNSTSNSSILTNDFFHPPPVGSHNPNSNSSDSDFIVDSSPGGSNSDSFLSDHMERIKISSPSSKSFHRLDNENSSQSNLGGYLSSNNNLQMYSNTNNNNDVDMYLRKSGGSLPSNPNSPISMGGALSLEGSNNNNTNSSSGNNSNSNSLKIKKMPPILQKESSQKSIFQMQSGGSIGSNCSNLSSSPSSQRKGSVSDAFGQTPPRKSSQPVAPSFSLLNVSSDSKVLHHQNQLSSSSHTSDNDLDVDDIDGDDDHYPSSPNSSYSSSSHNDTVPPVESVVVNVQPPRVGDECKVKCGDRWHDAVVDLVSGSTFVVTIKPFNIKREVSHSDVTLAPLQFPVITTKKKKFSLFGRSK
ncbi:hypothetical protein CYY_006368 [Polysphondylium violaceum]|uniref:non-specific serine/threonine protein kinase n=1 Tax=Polysphondylium violaceum TaxID=133409 RepID=A0A8J4UZ12_9MYCE|nr:hypothetical protein CYY_006368 [Polysphondylium violaceum]